MCNRHAIRANVNKVSKQAKRDECHDMVWMACGKESSANTRHFIALLRSQKLIWNLPKIFGILTSGFGHNRITSNELWNTETHKTDRNPPITNHNQWPFEPVEENFRFLRGPLRWLASDIFLTRGSKCTNHRKTVLIACFLFAVFFILCSFSFPYFVVGRFC